MGEHSQPHKFPQRTGIRKLGKENKRIREQNMKQKSIKNIRKEFKNNGIFYTPPKLAEKIKSYVDIEPSTVYDITFENGDKIKTVSYNEIKENDFNLSVHTYLPEEIEKEEIDPVTLKNGARQVFLSHLETTLKLEKFICETENTSIIPFLDDIEKVIQRYRS